MGDGVIFRGRSFAGAAFLAGFVGWVGAAHAAGVDGYDDEWPHVATMGAGTAGYSDRHWAYEDYVYDSTGGSSGNSGDLAILQITLTADAVRHVVKLNSYVTADPTLVALAVDTDCDDSTGGGAWPNGSGISTGGWEFVVHAGDGGAAILSAASDPVAIDSAANHATNVIELDVPRSFADPGAGSWCYRGAVGLGSGSWEQTTNVLFRNRVFDQGTASTDENDSGGFQSARQSAAISSGDLTDFRRVIDFGLLASGATVLPEPPAGDLHFTRIYDGPDFPNSRPEGVVRGDNAVTGSLYNGRFHPYRIFVPASYREDPSPAPMFPLLHGWIGDHRGFNPSGDAFWTDVVRAHRAIVPKPLGRGEEVWWEHLGELDVLAIVDDVTAHFNIDPDRIFLAGTSMGGLGTVKIAEQHPDRFAGIFPSVPPMSDRAQGYPHPDNNDWDLVKLAASLRNVPVLSFAGTIDALVPAGLDPDRWCNRLEELVYDHDCWRDLLGQHATYNTPRFAEIQDLLESHTLVRDPARVTYESHPVFRRQAAETGIGHLLPYDSVYWVSGIVYPAPPVDGGCDLEDCVADPPNHVDFPTFPTDPGTPRRLVTSDGISVIDVRTYGTGEGDPVATRIEDDPSPTLVRRGLVLTPGEAIPAENRFDLSVERVIELHLDLERMGLTLGDTLTARVTGDGVVRVGLVGSASGCSATLDGSPVSLVHEADRVVLELALDADFLPLSDRSPESLVVHCRN